MRQRQNDVIELSLIYFLILMLFCIFLSDSVIGPKFMPVYLREFGFTFSLVTCECKLHVYD